MATRLDQVRVEPYPDDFVPKMQQLLAILGDLDQRYEADRYHLENWSGPQAIKAQLLADLEQSHRANRERFEACLEELRLSARAHIEEMRRMRTSGTDPYDAHCTLMGPDRDVASPRQARRNTAPGFFLSSDIEMPSGCFGIGSREWKPSDREP
jgi:hypothetical protein